MIEQVTTENFKSVLPLIRAYQEFYCVPDINDEKNKNHFSQFLVDNSRGILFLARVENKAIGFATIYYSFSSARAEEVGILNDLYVLPEYRNNGYGRKLINRAIEEVKNKGLKRVQWLTAKNNDTAQILYEKLGANKSEWCFYAKEI